ncbi:MAG: hypothetical protein C5B50_23390 [Verrucomicrobia bacterium]|nr:MAG: hypothetical protein C5B50_23390 [Verrucomicrobiota bacterium]
MALDHLRWRQTEIVRGEMLLDARVCEFASSLECSSVLSAEKHGVWRNGGALFYHDEIPGFVESQSSGLPGIGYRLPHPPIPQLWFIPSCTFEQLLDASRFFGFPSESKAYTSDAVFSEIKSFLTDFDSHKRLAISQIQDSQLMLDLASPRDRLERAEAERINQFNKKCFGVRELEWEERDKIQNWIAKRFFIIEAA